MVNPLLLFLIAVPIGIQLLLAAFIHYDANDIGMNAPKWAAIVGLIPVFGLIAYLLTRSERDYDPETDPFRDHTFEIHPSRREEGEEPSTEGVGPHAEDVGTVEDPERAADDGHERADDETH